MTSFSFEVPIKHLEFFEPYQDFHFTLYQLYKDLRYTSFIAKQINKGVKGVWLDNGYNELMKATDSDNLINLTEQLDFTRIVCPDDPSWTTEDIEDSFLEMNLSIPSNRLLVVVNSEEMRDSISILGAKHFAIAYRVRMNTSIPQMQWATNCHFLGLLSLDEIVQLHPPSCDTSMPIKLAMKNQSMEAWNNKGCPHIHTIDLPDFFTAEMSDYQLRLAVSNIKWLKALANQGLA